MTIDTGLRITGTNLPNLSSQLESAGEEISFAACMAETLRALPITSASKGQGAVDTTAEKTDTLKEDGFTGFFKKLQEERIKELREEILQEMGLTEEDLSRMPPEQRSNIEALVSKEIQERLTAESAMDDDQSRKGMFETMLMISRPAQLLSDGEDPLS